MNPSSIISADFNGDGFKDLAEANYGSNNVLIFLGTGTGSFVVVDSFIVGVGPWSQSRSLTSADFNGDGFADLVTANCNDTSVSVLLGTGTGSFGTATNFSTNGSGPFSVISADFNGDTKFDLAVTLSYGVAILLGTGTGTFSSATNFTAGSAPRFLISADFNGDAKPDLAVANSGSSNVSILLGSGTGNFGAATNFAVGSNPFSIISNDFNGDAKADLALTNTSSNNISILLGTGTGNFSAATNFLVGNTPISVISADFSGDANIDLAVANNGSGDVSILLGTGSGSFGSPTNFVASNGPVSITSTDFNGDAKPDLAVANWYKNNISVLLNSPVNTISINTTATNICIGNSSILTATGSTTYSWSTSATTSTISVSPTVTTTYSVTDGVGCSNTATITINVATVAIPNICMVTTDSASNYNYNMIVWDKTPFTNVDSFIVYRYDVMSSSYLRIGAVSQNSLSEFRDTAFSIGGPNGGNPLYSSWLYKLAIRDTCGNIGAKSPQHQSMFVQQSGSTFSWNAYVGATVAGYSFLRDDNNTGAWHVLVNTAGLSTTDPNYTSYPNGNWRVDALGFNCTPTMLMGGNNNGTLIVNKKSHSNTSKPTAVGVNQISNNTNQILIYPNPSNSFVTIQSSSELGAVIIYNSLGEIVLQTKIKNTQEQIDISKFSSGIYTVQVQGRRMKLVKE